MLLISSLVMRADWPRAPGPVSAAAAAPPAGFMPAPSLA